jgi:hypothetical protein
MQHGVYRESPAHALQESSHALIPVLSNGVVGMHCVASQLSELKQVCEHWCVTSLYWPVMSLPEVWFGSPAARRQCGAHLCAVLYTVAPLVAAANGPELSQAVPSTVVVCCHPVAAFVSVRPMPSPATREMLLSAVVVGGGDEWLAPTAAVNARPSRMSAIVQVRVRRKLLVVMGDCVWQLHGAVSHHSLDSC